MKEEEALAVTKHEPIGVQLVRLAASIQNRYSHPKAADLSTLRGFHPQTFLDI